MRGRLDKNCNDGTNVQKTGAAAGQDVTLQTGGLWTCVGLSIRQNGMNFLSHVDAHMTPGRVQYFIDQIFGTNSSNLDGADITLINGDRYRDVDGINSKLATEVCLEALSLIDPSLPEKVKYQDGNGGFMATVFVPPRGDIYDTFQPRVSVIPKILEAKLLRVQPIGLRCKPFTDIIARGHGGDRDRGGSRISVG